VGLLFLWLTRLVGLGFAFYRVLLELAVQGLAVEAEVA
jgi:hypothetical protein